MSEFKTICCEAKCIQIERPHCDLTNHKQSKLYYSYNKIDYRVKTAYQFEEVCIRHGERI